MPQRHHLIETAGRPTRIHAARRTPTQGAALVFVLAVHLILGIVVILAGVGVMSGDVLARTIGVLVAALGMIVNFLAVPLDPLRSITLLTVDALVIWALIAHGAEMRTE